VLCGALELAASRARPSAPAEARGPCPEVHAERCMMKRCHHCRGPFGLVRYRHFTLQFCKRRCFVTWMRSRREKVLTNTVFDWLLRPG
jgi:hypothetical protein